MFCGCERMQLFYVASRVVRAVQKFGFRLVVNEKLRRHVMIETHVFDKIHMFLLRNHCVRLK